MKSHISQLDTQRFGFNITRVDNTADLLTTGLIPSLKMQGVSLIITRVDSERLDEINALEDLGFRIKDIQSTWTSRPVNPDAHNQYINPRIHIRQASPKDILPLRQIAAFAFDDYGHYFADSFLDRNRCAEIYPDWTERTITDPVVADTVFVAATHTEIAGFIALKKIEQEGITYATVVIGAVAAAFRRQNIYSTLIITGLAWGREQHLHWQEHQVLAVNYPVNRVLTKLGFLQVRSFVTLHGWLDR